jgi:2-haloacid dehalogenase
MVKTERKRKYDWLIFDADHTVLNFLADEKDAFCALYNELRVEITGELLSASRLASEETWTQAGLYDVHEKDVQARYHTVYRSHVEDIFKRLFTEFPLLQEKGVSARVLGDKFLKNLEAGGNYMDGAKETLSALSHKTGGAYRIAIATNGLSDIQRSRLKDLEKYADEFFISEEIGYIKPLPAFFEKAFARCQTDASRCLMIGDSLSSDMAGATAVGMDCCWINVAGIQNATEIKPTYEIHCLSALISLLESE